MNNFFKKIKSPADTSANYTPLTFSAKKKNSFKLSFKFSKISSPILRKVILMAVGVVSVILMFWYVNSYLYRFFASNPTASITATTNSTNYTSGQDVLLILNFPPTNATSSEISALGLKIKFDANKLDYIIGQIATNDQTGVYDILEETVNSDELSVIMANNSATDNVHSVSFKFKVRDNVTTDQLGDSTTVTLLQNPEIYGLNDSGSATKFDGNSADLDLANISFTPSTPSPTQVALTSTPTPDNSVTATPTPLPTQVAPTSTPTPDSSVTATPTQTPAPNEEATALNLKLRLQGVSSNPAGDKQTTAKVSLKTETGEVYGPNEIGLTANSSGVWEGSVNFNINRNLKYVVIVKPAKHLQKVICVASPTEALGGSYQCSLPEIQLQSSNNLDFSGIIILAGDIPSQNGVIDSADIAYVRQNFGNMQSTNLLRADLNFDGIVDTQDYALIMGALSFKYDEGI